MKSRRTSSRSPPVASSSHISRKGETENEFLGFYRYAGQSGETVESELPGHETGLDYVPHDDYVARLHEGEAVLTKNEASAWRAGGAAQPIDYDAMGAAVARAISGTQKVFTPDGRVLGDIVTERVSQNIAASSRSKRYNYG